MEFSRPIAKRSPSVSHSSPNERHTSASSYSPPPTSSSGSSFPILTVAVIGILATAILLVSYYIFLLKCCLRRRHRRQSSTATQHHPSFSDHISLHPPPPPAALPDKGLNEALIRLIPVIKFRKEDKTEQKQHLECVVCLCEFKQGEKLRVIPNCFHAFHIDCIDVWLQSSANCPLCRASISSNTFSDNHHRIVNYKSSTTGTGPPNSDPTTNPFRSGDEDADYVIIEIQDNNLDEPRSVSRQEKANNLDSTSFSGQLKAGKIKDWQRKKKSVGKAKLAMTSFDDEFVGIRAKDDLGRLIGGGGVQPLRRSVSLDLSSSRRLCLDIKGHYIVVEQQLKN